MSIAATVNLIVFGSFAFIVLLAVAIIAGFLYSQKKKLERIAASPLGTAVVKQVLFSASGGNYGGRDMELLLEVRPLDAASYEADVTWNVRRAGWKMTVEGAELPVHIDRKDPRKVYPAASWAEFLDVPPEALSGDEPA